ncbi:protein kinase [Georgenia phoenicis]|uniref:protein kinase domain-containing protein n=1 Tax=unclassified Georgenia TaxID=2626815 RepID=UPI0039B081FC
MARRRRSPGVEGGARPPQLPGHDIVGPVGFGAHGAVWAARDRGGRDVVVSVLALPRGEAGAAQLRRLAGLRHGTHPHLARVRQVLGLDGGRCAVVSDRVTGPTLATVLAARGGLEPPELAGLLAAVGSALGHLHERGIVHGDVSPANVVVTGGGVPVLVDLVGQDAHELGTPGFAPPERERGSAAGAPGDVWALARLVVWAAGPAPGAHLLGLLGPALDAVPEHRPSARDLASRAPGIGPAAPVAVPPAAALAQARMRDDLASTRRRPATRRQVQRTALTPAAAPGGRPPPRAAAPAARHVSRQPLPAPWLGGALTVGVAALLTGLIVWSAPGERAGGYGHRPAAADEPAAVAEAVSGLLARRDGALVAGDAAALAATTVAGGPAAREDVALLERLTATGTELERLRTEVSAVEAVAQVEEGVAVDVVLVQGAHERLVAGERVTVPAQEPACARLVLVPVPGETWQLLRSEPCP